MECHTGNWDNQTNTCPICMKENNTPSINIEITMGGNRESRLEELQAAENAK